MTDQPPSGRERWRRVEEICDAALRLSGSERDAYLATACGADAALRGEVDALLVHEQTSQEFLAAPIGAVAARVLEPPRDLIGTRFADYDIVAKLGEGGMGEVYRARDRTLGRDVAIKVLPAAVANDRERLKRFEREARLLASVNHPAIGAIYGLVEADGVHALVLELIEGETLSAALARGPLKLERALALAAQIADALDHAHRRSITHRDLKPSNIMLVAGGIKLLDFGIGKWSPAGSDVAHTRASTLTAEGAIVGTLHYMSPEQLEGRATDARSDIFAFGAVLYEMITGRKAFEGESQAGIIAAVLEAPAPRLASIGGPIGSRLDRIVGKCLAKHPDDRWQSAHDLADELRWLNAEATPAPGAEAAGAPVPRQSWTRFAASVAAIMAIGLAGWAAWSWRDSRGAIGASMPIRFTWQPDGTVPNGGFDISADGTQLVYAFQPAAGGVATLQVRRLDRFDSFNIPGTENPFRPTFSPDGQWVAFLNRGTLRKSRVSADATPITLVEDVGDAFQIAWPSDDVIYLVARNLPIRRVSANGGAPEAVTTIQPAIEVDHHGPELLPAGDTILFTVHSVRNRYSIAAQSLKSGQHKTIIESGFAPRYLQSGHLMFGRGTSLLAVPFDARALETRGEPVVLAEHMSADPSSGITDYRVSRSGTLVYQTESKRSGRLMVWVDRDGRETPLPITTRAFASPRLSPDGKQVAFVVEENDRRDIFTYDLASSNLAQLTQDGINWGPLWNHDGTGILFGRDAGATSQIVLYRPNGAPPETLASSVNNLWPTAVGRDGRAIVVTEDPPTNEYFLSQIAGNALSPLHKSGEPRFARLSHDGRWLAYTEYVADRVEVFVQGYPDAGQRRQITAGGGLTPEWRRDGKELYYRRGRAMFATAIDTSAGLKWGQPIRLFPDNYVIAFSYPSYDVAPDGRFLMIKPGPEEGAAIPLSIVTNWQAELASRVPIR
jgi:eukaryotic-like serine/threonine-protein kinase